MSKEVVTLEVLKVDQPLGEFYVGAIDARKLNDISFTEIRKFEEGTQDKLAGIQRDRSAKRIKELSSYVNFDYSTFPTSVILALDEKSVHIEKQGESNIYKLIIEDFEGDEDSPSISLKESAFIIDGQHRLAGLKHLDASRTFEVNVSIFIGADMADKAEIFRTVNLTQTKVNKSLSYDLFSYAKKKSPHKTAHEVVLALNEDTHGPFFKKIKRLGKATPGLGKIETLAQATVVEAIMRFITSNPDEERNQGFLNLATPKRSEQEWRRYIFQDFFDEDDKVSIVKVMTNYFSAVEQKWGPAWSEPEEGYILNRTTGFSALMRFLKEMYIKMGERGSVPSQDEFYALFANMNIKNNDLTSENFKPGSSGSSALFKRLIAESGN